MSIKPKLYIGLDTQDLQWNLVCGTAKEPVWIDKTPDYAAASLRKSLEFARCKSGFEYEGYEPVLLFEDIAWGGSIAGFFQDNGVTVHILDETSVPADLCEDISEEGFYSAEILYKILIRKFVDKKRTAFRTLDAEHGFARDIDILHRERKQLRKEYKKHIARIRTLISDAGCKTKSPQDCRFDHLYNSNDEPMPLYHRLRLEHQRIRAELVMDHFYIVDDEFGDCLKANVEIGREEGKVHVDDPEEMKKSGLQPAEIKKDRIIERTDHEILLKAFKIELKKLKRENNSHKSQIMSWIKNFGAEVDKKAELIPVAVRIDRTHKLPRSLIMLLQRIQERQALATEQYGEIEGLIEHCSI